MTAISLEEGFDLWVKSTEKKWRHDRSKSVGASEAFGCLRRAYFQKTGAERDANHDESWGAMRRGDIIENNFVAPAMEWFLENHFPKARLVYAGKKQQTFIDEASQLSATPDGLVINADDDALSLYDVPSLGGTGCFNFEVKSIDPRVNLVEEKSQHRGQVQVQMGLTREKTRFRPNFAVIVYVDASFLDDIDVFVVPFEPKTYEAAKTRAKMVYAATEAKDIPAEGRMDGSCTYCPFKAACSGSIEAVTPRDGSANADDTPSPLMTLFGELVADYRAKAKAKKLAEAEHAAASETLKQWFRDVGVKSAQVGPIKASLSWIKGRKTVDVDAMRAAGIDLTPFEKTGNGYDRMTVSEKGAKNAANMDE